MSQLGRLTARQTKVGDVLKNEYDPASGYCRELVTVRVPAGGLSVGAVLEATSVSNVYVLIVAAQTANAAGVLVDDNVYNLSAGDHSLAVLTRGPAIVADDSLTYGSDIDTGPERTAVQTALATRGIRTFVQV